MEYEYVVRIVWCDTGDVEYHGINEPLNVVQRSILSSASGKSLPSTDVMAAQAIIYHDLGYVMNRVYLQSKPELGPNDILDNYIPYRNMGLITDLDSECSKYKFMYEWTICDY